MNKYSGMLRSISKKVLAGTLLAALAFGFVLSGCSSSQSTPGNEPQVNQPESSQPAEPTNQNTSANQPTAEESKVLVAYFSASGNTERIAQIVANELSADTFVVMPVTPYTAEDLSWNTDGSRVNAEHDNPARVVELQQVTPPNFASYDTVFVGYPIWWGEAAWPIDGFVAGNDFNGKTVIPFCTSSSSPLGNSATLLQQMANGGSWKEGIRFSSSADANTVLEWLNTVYQAS